MNIVRSGIGNNLCKTIKSRLDAIKSAIGTTINDSIWIELAVQCTLIVSKFVFVRSIRFVADFFAGFKSDCAALYHIVFVCYLDAYSI